MLERQLEIASRGARRARHAELGDDETRHQQRDGGKDRDSRLQHVVFISTTEDVLAPR